MCGHLECPGYSFKCASGSCISSQLVCNGKTECFDGSDEAPLLCNTTGGPPVPMTNNPPVEQIGCALPLGEERPILKDVHGNVLTPPIVRGTVKFYCKSGYFREGPESSHCANRKWSVHVVPKCVSEYRPSTTLTELCDLYQSVFYTVRVLRRFARLCRLLEGSTAGLLYNAHVCAQWSEGGLF